MRILLVGRTHRGLLGVIRMPERRQERTFESIIGNVCSWLESEVQAPEFDFRLYEALVVKVVVVCVA
jgi:hypothetical protein